MYNYINRDALQEVKKAFEINAYDFTFSTIHILNYKKLQQGRKDYWLANTDKETILLLMDDSNAKPIIKVFESPFDAEPIRAYQVDAINYCGTDGLYQLTIGDSDLVFIIIQNHR